MKKSTRIVSLLFAALLIAFSLTACGEKPYGERPVVNVATLKGPTGIGMVELMNLAESEGSENQYSFTLAGAPDEIVAKLSNGEADVAAVPVNLAATLYNKTSGNIRLAAINTLGVLYILERGESVQSVADLRGKTIHATGQGSTPEYVLRYILTQNGIDPDKDVTIEYHAEHAELASLLAAGEVDLAMLPEPNVTAVLMKDEGIRIALDLTDEWDAACQKEGKTDAALAMGVLVVRADWLEDNEKVFKTFLEEYQQSADFVEFNLTDAANLVERYGIMASAEAAKKAIPNCNVTFISGEEMKTRIENLYAVLFAADPKSLGGTLPDDAFYYLGK